MWPSARSGFQFFVFQDEIFLYGGYSKEVAADKNNSEKGIVHADLWSLDPRTWEWNKVKKTGMPPGPRAGFSMCNSGKSFLCKKTEDFTLKHLQDARDVMMSLFLNELYGFQLDNHRWYPLELRKGKPTKDKTKKRSDQQYDLDNKSNHGDVEMLEINESLENYEEAPDMESGADEISQHIKKNLTVSAGGFANLSNGKPQERDINSDQQSCISPEVVKPCGRINSCMAVGRDTLYIYGGTMEVKDQEITLDDLYTLNLSKLDEWKCIVQASESEWLEVSEDEDEDEDDTDDEEDGSESDSEDTDDEDDGEAADGVKSVEMADAVSILKGQVKNLRRKEKRARIEQIRANLGLSDSQRTPMPGETLRDFYKRTNLYWQMAAHEHTQHTGKELRKDGFDLADARYKELKPILDELAILEAEQKAEEEQGPETSSRKRGGKKNKSQASQRNSGWKCMNISRGGMSRIPHRSQMGNRTRTEDC
ncbi:Kelch domain-containing protein [Thalictrum thalictroides]|uniref:Kelch domain-containing protein n=1 Tax=Thalictrum thalictroides TaxID=46969 RepID=A0A7J6X586_THATH|nr:Kelch domain-containing protein [Thalictrum thalictroides]